jgi:hypothetical protein
MRMIIKTIGSTRKLPSNALGFFTSYRTLMRKAAILFQTVLQSKSLYNTYREILFLRPINMEIAYGEDLAGAEQSLRYSSGFVFRLLCFG